ARDLAEWLERRSLPAPLRSSWTRAAFACAASIAALAAVWTAPRAHNGIGIAVHRVPVAACDWIEAHGIRGRVVNAFSFARRALPGALVVSRRGVVRLSGPADGTRGDPLARRRGGARLDAAAARGVRARARGAGIAAARGGAQPARQPRNRGASLRRCAADA